MADRPEYGIEDVVANDWCIGCGGCAYLDSQTSVTLTGDGLYSASLGDVTSDLLDQVCPFSDRAPNEDQIGQELYASLPNRTPELGYYLSTYAGRITSDDMRIGSSSGGLVSWTATELLVRRLVDGVIHVKANYDSGSPMFNFGVSTTVDELVENRKSVYYPVEFSTALETARKMGGKFCFIGIPCHIKAIRQLQLVDDWASENIVATIGLVCGHMKGTGFSESLGWQTGVEPINLLSVDFRVKDPNSPANRYRFAATDARDGNTYSRPNFEMTGSNWGHAFFQPNACNYCDDVFAELADISFGDAWLPRFEADSLGNNVVVVRTPQMETMLKDGVAAGNVTLESLNESEAIATQAGNIRHRRVGLSIRMADDDAMGLPHPRKRVPAEYGDTEAQRISLVRLRRISSRLSFEAFEEAKARSNFGVFERRIYPAVRAYDVVSAKSLPKRVLARLPLRVQRGLRTFANRIR